MIELFYSETPNGRKISIMLEEIKFDYKITEIDLSKGDQFNINFRKISPLSKIPTIIDHKNNSGWIHVSQLKRINSVIATKDKVLFKKPTSFAEPIALIKKGRLLIVLKCEKKWCEIETDNFNGWVKSDNLWGLIN